MNIKNILKFAVRAKSCPPTFLNPPTPLSLFVGVITYIYIYIYIKFFWNNLSMVRH